MLGAPAPDCASIAESDAPTIESAAAIASARARAATRPPLRCSTGPVGIGIWLSFPARAPAVVAGCAMRRGPRHRSRRDVLHSNLRTARGDEVGILQWVVSGDSRCRARAARRQRTAALEALSTEVTV